MFSRQYLRCNNKNLSTIFVRRRNFSDCESHIDFVKTNDVNEVRQVGFFKDKFLAEIFENKCMISLFSLYELKKHTFMKFLIFWVKPWNYNTHRNNM